MTIHDRLDGLIANGEDISVMAWLDLESLANGNAPAAYVSNTELELVDQGYGWEYRAVKTEEPWNDEAFIAFNPRQVTMITVDYNEDPLVVIIFDY